MYVRMTFFKVKPGMMEALRNVYVNELTPSHSNHQGLRFVHLLENMEHGDEGISVTAWDTKGDLERYEKSGDHQKLVGRFRDMFVGETSLKSYEVTASSEPMILRIF